MIEIKPPNRAVSANGTYSIFLAGSIEMGKADNWQDRLVESFKDLHGVIYNPRRDDWDNSWEQKFTNPNFYQQVNWELRTLDDADLIVMYFDPSTKSPISLLELGLYADSGKLMVCCPKEFWRRGNVEIVCEKYGIPLMDDLEQFEKVVKLRIKNNK